MTPKTRAIATLVIITPFLTELLVGNMAPSPFFLALPILFVAYSIPVLVIREISARWNLGPIGLILLGIAYGILNEGIWAKTLFMQHSLPVSQFNNYGFWGSINFSWTASILIWHALHSVLFPILITHFLFKDRGKEAWLSTKHIFFIAPFGFLGAASFFLGPQKDIVPPFYLLICIAAIAALGLLAKFFPTSSVPRPIELTWSPFILGLFLPFLFIATSLLAAMRVHLSIYYICFALLLALSILLFKKKGWSTTSAVTLFAVGDYSTFAALGAIVSYTKSSPSGVIAGILLMILLLSFAFFVKRNASERLF